MDLFINYTYLCTSTDDPIDWTFGIVSPCNSLSTQIISHDYLEIELKQNIIIDQVNQIFFSTFVK